MARYEFKFVVVDIAIGAAPAEPAPPGSVPRVAVVKCPGGYRL